MISYFNDRILTPEMMRAMIILYIGPYNRPDFSTDFLLSPVLAPEALLARFPKTYFLTGERDPLVDDTVIFAGRIRQAKLHQFRERQELGLEKSRLEFDEKEHVEVSLIPGISHGFVNFVSVFPEGWRQLFRCAGWIGDLFDRAGRIERSRPEAASRNGSGVPVQKAQKLRRDTSGSANGVSPSTSSALPTGRNGSANGSATPRHHRRGLTGESSGDEDRPLEMSMLGTSKSSTDGQQSQSPRSKFSRPPASLSMTPTKNHKKKDSSTTNGHAVSPADSSAKARSYFLPSTPNAADLNVDSIDSDFTAGPQPPAQTGKQRQQQQQLALQLPLSMSMSMSMRRDASFTSLPSEEDLLRRRMEGLAGGLMGIGEGAKTP
jgi:battenin